MIIMILAGGLGTRLSPLSTEIRPKPFITFSSKRSLLQDTLSRFITRKSISQIFICAHRDHKELILEEISSIDKAKKCQIILEPERNNTLCAITYCLCHLDISARKRPVFVVPIDHFIHPEQKFIEALEKSAAALPKDKLLLLGVTPITPETEYGYMKLGHLKNELFYTVEEFIEKPSKEKAAGYLSSKNYLWNMGIIGFYSNCFFNQLSIHQPQFEKMRRMNKEEMLTFYKEVEPQSVDRGLLQKSREVLCIQLDIIWSDVGSLDRFYSARKILEEQRA